MVDNKTSHLELPLPNLGNQQDEDVPRIAEALAGLDAHAAQSDARMAVAEEALAGLGAHAAQSDARMAGAEEALGDAAARIDVLGGNSQEHQERLNILDEQLKEANARAPGTAEDGKLGLTMPGRGLHIATPGKLDVDIASPLTLGIGRVATLADMAPGATVTNDPAFLTAGGVVTPTPTAYAVPQAGADGRLAVDWFRSMLCNMREIITTSRTWVAPCDGWYLVIPIGGGGGGGKGGYAVVLSDQNGSGGKQGGTTSFGNYVSAPGGSGGAGGAGGNIEGAAGGGGGGAAGIVVKRYVYLNKNTAVTIIIGAGGIGATAVYGVAHMGGSGEGPYAGKGGSFVPGQGAVGAGNGQHGSNEPGSGGNGAINGFGYGGGGGGGASQENNRLNLVTPGGRAADGAQDGQYTSGTYPSATSAGNGGNGGNGAVIIEYFNPSVTN